MSDSHPHAIHESFNAVKSIVERINDVKGLCAAGKLGNFTKDMQDDVVMVENTMGANNIANDTQQKMMTGVVVNGFHPQLSDWQKNQSNIEKIENCNDSINKLDGEISRVVNSCRTEEHESVCRSDAMDQPRFSKDKAVSDIYCDVFENSNIAQVITTPGGRVGAWNKEFLKLCSFEPTGPYASLTMFDLVETSALPTLHQIFLRALYEECPGNGESSNHVKYLALTVPCIKLSPSESYFITLSLMNDHDPDNRCFHCILSTKPTSKIGEIVYIQQNALMGML